MTQLELLCAVLPGPIMRNTVQAGIPEFDAATYGRIVYWPMQRLHFPITATFARVPVDFRELIS